MGLYHYLPCPIFQPPKNMLSQEHHDFLLEYPGLVSDYASYNFPLTQEQLRKYYDLLVWDFVRANEAIKWNADIIGEFLDDLLPAEDPGYQTTDFSLNDSIQWSVELIDRFIDRWNWDNMVCNHVLPREIRLHYHDRLCKIEEYDPVKEEQLEQREDNCYLFDTWLEFSFIEHKIEMMEKHPELCIQNPDDIQVVLVDWNMLSSNEFLPWSEELIARFQDNWNWLRLSRNESIPWSSHLIGRFGYRLDWQALSRNPALPWNEDFIARYAPYWNFGALSENSGVPWSLDLLRKYEAVVAWGVDRENEDGTTDSPASSISRNMSLPWTIEIWAAYHDRLDPSYLASSSGINWDFETIKAYCKHWGSGTELSNPKILFTVFPVLEAPEAVISLMDEILEKYKQGDYKSEEE